LKSGIPDCVNHGSARQEERRIMRELEDPEYREIWDAFYKIFRFRPGLLGPYPGIDEPKPSVTFKLPEDLPAQEDLVELAETIRSALQVCTQPDEEIYYLDWHHVCYAIKPYEDPLHWFNAYPNGDYAIFLSKDLSFGTFGHPWEGTICCFGEKFIRAILERQPLLLIDDIRSRGL